MQPLDIGFFGPMKIYSSTSEELVGHFYAALGKNFDAAPAPTLLYSKAKI
jgi:hypothetical protein